MSELLRVIDETGCRLSEVSKATGEAVAFLTAGGNVLGGVLTLHHHKTDERVGVRHVPLSRYAAQVLYARKTRCGDGALFPGLPVSSSDVCASFDKARKAVGIADLLIKDFRRGFITRNAHSMSKLELTSVVGPTSLLDLGSLAAGDRSVQAAAGHTDPRTTLGYVSPEHEAMAQAFTASSRWPAVAAILNPSDREAAAADEAAELEREMGELLARMRKLGMTAVA
jgi:integrase